MKMRKSVKCILFATCLGVCGASTAQIAVFDPSSFARQLQQLEEARAQLEQARNQFSLQQREFQNMNGLSSLAGLNPQELDRLANRLPGEWRKFYDSLRSSGELTGEAGDILQRDRQQIEGRSVSEAEEYVRKQQSGQYAADEARVSGAYDEQVERIDELKTALRSLNQSSTAKEVMDMQARMQVTQASIMIERNKIELARMLSEINRERVQDQADENLRRQFLGDENSDNASSDFTHIMD